MASKRRRIISVSCLGLFSFASFLFRSCHLLSLHTLLPPFSVLRIASFPASLHTAANREVLPQYPLCHGPLGSLAQILLLQTGLVSSHLKLIISLCTMSWNFPVSRCCWASKSYVNLCCGGWVLLFLKIRVWVRQAEIWGSKPREQQSHLLFTECFKGTYVVISYFSGSNLEPIPCAFHRKVCWQQLKSIWNLFHKNVRNIE